MHLAPTSALPAHRAGRSPKPIYENLSQPPPMQLTSSSSAPVSLGLQAGHKVFVCENVSDALGVQHGATTARPAALASEHAYVMHLCVMDPTKHNGGCQTRPRPHFVFVQSALHALRGKNDVPIPPATSSTPTTMQHLSGPPTLPQWTTALRDLYQWPRSRYDHEYTNDGALMEYTCRTGPKTAIRAYNPNGPCPTTCILTLVH
jgi:hypothetical protein